MATLSAENVACQRGERRVFADLSFTVRSGESLVLTGPNGSGKSTLLRLLAGLLRAQAGRLTWDGAAIADDRDAHAARLAYLGHADAVKPALTVLDDLRFWGRWRNGGADAAPTALDRVGLRDQAATPGRYLSAGQRRRVALARLLLAPAALWLLDEPTVGLDRGARDALDAMLADHLGSGGIAVVATHQHIALADARVLDLGATTGTGG